MYLDLHSVPVAGREKSSLELNLGVVWESRYRVFVTSLRDFFAGPRPAKDSEVPSKGSFQVDWIRGRLPGRAFVASCLWHVAAVLILILPIWGFLPKVEYTLPPVQIEITYVPAKDLPPISLPVSLPKRSVPAKRSENAPQPESVGADAYHPRQTILSMPVEVTHPKQTLIQPDAPAAPKIDAQLPNMVQWNTAPAKPQLQLDATNASPTIRKRVDRNIAAPNVASSETNPALLNIAAASKPNPQMPVSPMTSAVAQNRQARPDAAVAPEVGLSSTDSNLRRLIALSATPAPPAPEVKVPAENLAARVAVSPDGKTSGTPGADRKVSNGTSGSGLPSEGLTGNPNSLPAAISVSGGASRAGTSPAPGLSPGKLNLNPMTPALAPARKGPSVVGTIKPNTAPEQILSGKEVHTLDISAPNLTSVAGSWILNFAQLDETGTPPYEARGQLSGPVPIEKVDPKYPPELIKEHVEGQVVLYAIITKDGGVRGVQLVHGIEPELDKNAMEAFAQWKFHPGARDGMPIDLEAVVYIPFRFRPPE
jgi:TonB family protein